MKQFTPLILIFCISSFSFAQNTGIGTTNPTEKLHIDNGNVKIGNFIWNSSNKSMLKFGDSDYLTVGEEEADDKLTIRGAELFIRPSSIYTKIPVSIQGSQQYSHFNFDTNEDTYIRGGKASSNVVIGSDLGGRIGLSVYPQRAALEQNGSVGSTSAIFGGNGAGISLQNLWPVVGFNHYHDGANHRSIAQGYSAQLGLNQNNGSLYLASWPFAAIPNANLNVNSPVQRFHVSRFGKLGLGTDDPYTDLHIYQKSYSNDDGNSSAWENGITLQAPAPDNTFWNIGNGKIKTCVNVNLAFLDPLGIIGSLVNGCTTYSALVFQYNGISKACIRSDGEYRQMSDARYKKNISPVKDQEGLAAILRLKPVKYHFTDEQKDNNQHYGFLAQDVEKIFPQFVDEVDNHKVLGYQSFIPVLTKAIQEQQHLIATLQKENAGLKQRIEKIETILRQYK